jgi:hypothetical protein
MATDTQPPQAISFPSRVLAIPLVSHSIDTIHCTLSNSPYTKGVYQTGSGFAQSAYDTATRVTVASPVYPRLQPVITAADGYANKGLDTIQSRFPYPFETTPDQVYNDLKKAPEDARNVAYKTIDERITTPAYGIAKGVDSRLAPLVDLLESILTKLHAAPPHSPVASTSTASDVTSEKAQVTRAKELVFGAKDHIIVLTTEQAKALKDQNVYIQRAAEQAASINATLSTHYQNAQAGVSAYKGKGVELGKEAQSKVYALSQSMITELEKVQNTTASLPSHIQTTFKPLTDEVGSTLTEMKAVLTSQEEGLGVGEKAGRLGGVIKERIGPIVEKSKQVYATAVEKFMSKKDQAVAASADAGEHLTNGTS